MIFGITLISGKPLFADTSNLLLVVCLSKNISFSLIWKKIIA